MRDLILIIALFVLSGYVYHVMGKVDAFIEENERNMKKDKDRHSLD